MKKILTLIALGSLFATATARAQVNIYLTGSTAFRANTYRSIRSLYGANLASQNPADPASSQNKVTWSGTIPSLFGNQTVTVLASYSGSVAGIRALVQNSTLTFLSSATAGDTNTTTAPADLALSDVFQSASPFLTPTLTDKPVGVVVFAYVKSVTTPASVNNITIQQMQAFLANGQLPLSYFTGATNDDTTPIYLVGRDSGSGTRATAERDALFVGSPLLYTTTNGCNWSIYSGFASGSGIVGVLNGNCGPAIGYLGLPDAANVASGANIIAYNGVMPFTGPITSPDFTPVRKGLYSFWGYEHLFKRSAAPANVGSFWTALAAAIDTDLATSISAIQVSTMRVSRNADGGPITPNF